MISISSFFFLDSEADLNDEIRQVLIAKAGEGDMTAVIFYLKNRHPDFKQKEGGNTYQYNDYRSIVSKLNGG